MPYASACPSKYVLEVQPKQEGVIARLPHPSKVDEWRSRGHQLTFFRCTVSGSCALEPVDMIRSFASFSMEIAAYDGERTRPCITALVITQC